MILSGLFKRKIPRGIIFEVTPQCNFDCLYCYNVWKGDPDYPVEQLDTERTLAMLDRVIRQMRLRSITLTGGEPLLRRDLAQIVDFIHQRGISINMITNGSLVNDQVVEQYRGKIQTWEIPLLSHRREIHNKLVRRENAFDKVTYAAATLKAAGQSVVQASCSAAEKSCAVQCRLV